MKDRIKAIMESQHMSQKLFSDFTGINPGTLSLLLRDKAQPTLNTYEAIHKHFPDISMEWLFDGQGPMYKKDVAAQNDGAAVSADGASASADGSALSSDGSATPASGDGSASPLFSGSNQQQAAVLNQIGKSVEKAVVKYVDKPQRKITEIRVFFDDQTWESFVPKKEE